MSTATTLSFVFEALAEKRRDVRAGGVCAGLILRLFGVFIHSRLESPPALRRPRSTVRSAVHDASILQLQAENLILSSYLFQFKGFMYTHAFLSPTGSRSMKGLRVACGCCCDRIIGSPASTENS